MHAYHSVDCIIHQYVFTQLCCCLHLLMCMIDFISVLIYWPLSEFENTPINIYVALNPYHSKLLKSGVKWTIEFKFVHFKVVWRKYIKLCVPKNMYCYLSVTPNLHTNSSFSFTIEVALYTAAPRWAAGLGLIRLLELAIDSIFNLQACHREWMQLAPLYTLCICRRPAVRKLYVAI